MGLVFTPGSFFHSCLPDSSTVPFHIDNASAHAGQFSQIPCRCNAKVRANTAFPFQRIKRYPRFDVARPMRRRRRRMGNGNAISERNVLLLSFPIAIHFNQNRVPNIFAGLIFKYVSDYAAPPQSVMEVPYPHIRLILALSASGIRSPRQERSRTCSGEDGRRPSSFSQRERFLSRAGRLP